jgi:hypothetical protein
VASPLIPPILVCPDCAHDDDVSVLVAPAGDEWIYTCRYAGHRTPVDWTKKRVAEVEAADGIMAELGLYEDLPRCLVSGEPWVEYGIVEHRYKLLRPEVYFGHLLPKYSHTAVGPKSYTLSAFLAHALSRLRALGDIDYRWGKATGYWDYNSQVSYWALVPVPPDEPVVTWSAFATAEGLDPAEWLLGPAV